MFLGDDATGTAPAPAASSWITDVTQAIQTVVPAALQTVSQQKLINANLQRAQQGLPPLDISSVTPGVTVGLSPQTQKLLMYAGGAAIALAVAFLILKALKK